MKILAISGSARRGSNTELLIREVLSGAGAPEDLDIRVLSEMHFHGCIGCRGCRKEGSKGCVVKDDMQELYAEMRDADAIILGSPIFYGEITGQMKCFMDRWYALRDKDRKLRIPPGKKALFIITQGADGEERYSHTVKRLDKVLRSYEMEPVMLVAPGVERLAEVKERPELLKLAHEAGKRLAGK
jgi:multimeric flavodoxin WrbA